MMATFDPTRTTLLRRKHLIDIRARMNRLKKWIQRWLVTDDMLGLGDKPRLTFNVVREFEFATSEQKLAAFRRHFENQINAGLLEVTNTGQPWTEQYVSSAYRKGQERAYFDVKKGTRAERLPFYAGSKTDFLRSSFFAPEAVSKVALLASRSFEELRGISAATSQQINRILADGLINGQGPATIAREMTKQIDTITSRRALTLARTEIIHAHAEGQLDSFERLGIETVSPQVEWLTAGDERVCVECDEFSGDVFTIDEARGMIPWHPNCRCAWTPGIAKLTIRARAVTAGGKAFEDRQADDARRRRLGLPRRSKVLKSIPKSTVATEGTQYRTADEYRKQLIAANNSIKTTAAVTEVKVAEEAVKDYWKSFMLEWKNADSWTESQRKIWRTAQRLKLRELEAVLTKTKKAATFDLAAQRQLLNEVNNFVGEITLDKKWQSIADDILSWVPKKRAVSHTIRDVSVRTVKGSVDGAAEYTVETRAITMFKQSKQLFAHEFGHHLQYNLTGFDSAQTAFFNLRTRGEKTIELLRGIFGKKDKWSVYDKYAGRIYADGSASEVASVGIEYIWKNPVKAAIKDPEWFNMIISQLKGIPIQ